MRERKKQQISVCFIWSMLMFIVEQKQFHLIISVFIHFNFENCFYHCFFPNKQNQKQITIGMLNETKNSE